MRGGPSSFDAYHNQKIADDTILRPVEIAHVRGNSRCEIILPCRSSHGYGSSGNRKTNREKINYRLNTEQGAIFVPQESKWLECKKGWQSQTAAESLTRSNAILQASDAQNEFSKQNIFSARFRADSSDRPLYVLNNSVSTSKYKEQEDKTYNLSWFLASQRDKGTNFLELHHSQYSRCVKTCFVMPP